MKPAGMNVGRGLERTGSGIGRRTFLTRWHRVITPDLTKRETVAKVANTKAMETADETGK